MKAPEFIRISMNAGNISKINIGDEMYLSFGKYRSRHILYRVTGFGNQWLQLQRSL